MVTGRFGSWLLARLCLAVRFDVHPAILIVVGGAVGITFISLGDLLFMFTYDFPYPSQRMPVLARNVVATSQPLAAQAGLQMLSAGGNAVDAALAAAIALAVVEPTSNGIGSDAFAILWDGGELVGLNASGRSPKALNKERFQRFGLGSFTRLGRGDGSGCGLVVGFTFGALRQAPV